MMRFKHDGAPENLTDFLTTRLIEEGDPQNFSSGSMLPLGIVTSDLFLPLICHLQKSQPHCQPAFRFLFLIDFKRFLYEKER